MKKAVILFNLGGPDKLENVEPFLFNLGHGVLPQIKPETIEYIIQLVRSKK